MSQWCGLFVGHLETEGLGSQLEITLQGSGLSKYAMICLELFLFGGPLLDQTSIRMELIIETLSGRHKVAGQGRADHSAAHNHSPLRGSAKGGKAI